MLQLLYLMKTTLFKSYWECCQQRGVWTDNMHYPEDFSLKKASKTQVHDHRYDMTVKVISNTHSKILTTYYQNPNRYSYFNYYMINVAESSKILYYYILNKLLSNHYHNDKISYCILHKLLSNRYHNDEISFCPNTSSECKMTLVWRVLYYEGVYGHG
jgi:hypothetical protein